MKQCTVCQREYDEKKVFCPYDGNLLVRIKENEPYIGSTVDNKYQIDYKIAEGGMGDVYHALHLQLNTPVAIKIMHGNLVSDSTAIERFRREAQAAMKIHHTNAIAVMDFGVTKDGTVYLVMEYLTGCTLRQRLKEVGRIQMLEANRILQQICAAVNVAHKRKIIHRDLKSDNIFLQQEQESGEEIVKVLDFGIAKLKDFSGSITKQGMVVGTPHYMSPEQCYGREVDVRSDIYSLGVILYEMLAGKLPFEAPSSIALAVKQTTEKPPPICEIQPDIPAVINAVVMHALEKLPEKRPQTVLDFAREFEAALQTVAGPEEVLYKTKALEPGLPPTALRPDPAKSRPPARRTTHGEAVSTSPELSESEVAETEVLRERIKERKHISLPVTAAKTYSVTCERCGEEVGRSVIPNSTIICPSCRTKMRGK